MSQDIENYIKTLRQAAWFQKAVQGVVAGHDQAVLLGQAGYRMTSQWDMEDQNTQYVIYAYHGAIQDGKIAADRFERVMQTIDINDSNILLLLSYLNDYQTSQQNSSLVPWDYYAFWQRLKQSEAYKFGTGPVQHLGNKIETVFAHQAANQSSPSSQLPDLTTISQFTLGLITTVNACGQLYGLSQFLNHRFNLFPDISAVLQELEGHGLIESQQRPNGDLYQPTPAAYDYCRSLDFAKVCMDLDLVEGNLLQRLRTKMQQLSL